MYIEKHEFAIYFEFQDEIELNQLLKITDEQFYHRLVRVLRQEANDLILLFDKHVNVLAKIKEINKKDILLQILKINQNIEFQPQITVLLSLLKKEAFEEAIYYCTELGANIIQPVISHKSHKKVFDSKENERLKKIIISAAEQSKNFKFPELKDPITIQDLLETLNKDSIKIYFDPKGKALIDVLKDISDQKPKDIYLMIGPEGDLTKQEKELLERATFSFCALTPTILRAHIAVAISLGVFRSIF